MALTLKQRTAGGSTEVIGVDPKHIGWIYLAFNIWNVLNDPVFAVLLDKMRYRPGRGKFLLVGNFRRRNRGPDPVPMDDQSIS